MSWELIPIISIICGTVVSLAGIKAKMANSKSRRGNDPKILDNIHVIEMRMQDLEIQLRQANQKIMLLEEKKYKEID